MKIHGRPLFILYRPPALPDAQRTTDTFRSECVRLGIPEPYIVGRDTHNLGIDMRQFGCDITESSAPQLSLLPGVFAPAGRLADWRRNIRLGVWCGRLKIFDYQEACQLAEAARSLWIGTIPVAVAVKLLFSRDQPRTGSLKHCEKPLQVFYQNHLRNASLP